MKSLPYKGHHLRKREKRESTNSRSIHCCVNQKRLMISSSNPSFVCQGRPLPFLLKSWDHFYHQVLLQTEKVCLLRRGSWCSCSLHRVTYLKNMQPLHMKWLPVQWIKMYDLWLRPCMRPSLISLSGYHLGMKPSGNTDFFEISHLFLAKFSVLLTVVKYG